MKGRREKKKKIDMYNVGIGVCIVVIIVALVIIIEPKFDFKIGNSNSNSNNSSVAKVDDNNSNKQQESSKNSNNENNTSTISNSTNSASNKVVDSVEIVSPNVDLNKDLTEDEALNIAMKQFEKLGETTLKREDVKIHKIQRNGKEYYYATTTKNTLELEAKGGKMFRINNVVVND